MDLACAVRHGHRPPLLAEPKTTAHVPGSESARPCPALAGTDALAPMTWAQQGQRTVVPTPCLSHRKRSSLLLGLGRPPGTLPVPTPQSAGPGLVPHLPPSMCPGAHMCVHTHMHTHPAHMHACHTCTCVHAGATPAHTYHKLHACMHIYTTRVCACGTCTRHMDHMCTHVHACTTYVCTYRKLHVCVHIYTTRMYACHTCMPHACPHHARHTHSAQPPARQPRACRDMNGPAVGTRLLPAAICSAPRCCTPPCLQTSALPSGHRSKWISGSEVWLAFFY